MPVQIMQRQNKKKENREKYYLRKEVLKYRDSGKSKNVSESTNTF